MSAYAIVGREAAQAVAACLRQRGMPEAPVWLAGRGQGATALEDAAPVRYIGSRPGVEKVLVQDDLACDRL